MASCGVFGCRQRGFACLRSRVLLILSNLKKLQYANCEFRTCDGQLHLSREFCPAARQTGLTAECAAQVTLHQLHYSVWPAEFSLCVFFRLMLLLLLPCVLHFIFIEQDRPRTRPPCPEHAFSCPTERQKRRILIIYVLPYKDGSKGPARAGRSLTRAAHTTRRPSKMVIQFPFWDRNALRRKGSREGPLWCHVLLFLNMVCEL